MELAGCSCGQGTGTLQPGHCLLKAGMFPFNEAPLVQSGPELHSVLGDMGLFSLLCPGLLNCHGYCTHWLYSYLYIVRGFSLFILTLSKSNKLSAIPNTYFLSLCYLASVYGHSV